MYKLAILVHIYTISFTEGNSLQKCYDDIDNTAVMVKWVKLPTDIKCFLIPAHFHSIYTRYIIPYYTRRLLDNFPLYFNPLQ